MPVVAEIAARQAELIGWRRHLHARPELAFHEHGTADFVAAKLEGFGLEVHRGLARTGVVASLSCGNSDAAEGRGRSIGLRADLDALPMQELSTFEHRSQHDGCAHACGHDGHTTMLLAAAEHLASTRHFTGTVHFIFQPAEETAGGGQVMVEEGLFDRFPCDEIYALHNWPALPLGQVAILPGAVMAATDQWDLTVVGKGGHAAFPDQTVDPIFVATQIVQAWQGIISRNTSPTSPAVLSTTQFHAGTAYNVIAEKALLSGTVRTIEPSLQNTLETRMAEVATAVAQGWHAEARFDYKRGYPATINDPTCAQYAVQAAARTFEKSQILEDLPPSMGGEDFAFMLQRCPGAYLWLGQGSSTHSAGLHNAHYDFNDDALALGASLHVSLVEARLA